MVSRKGRGAKKGGNRKSGKQKKEKKSYPEVTGRVQMTREGYVFVIADGEIDDVFVKASKTLGALHGDTVRVAITKEKTDRQRREGQVLEIVARSPRPFVGILHIVGNQAWVLMQSRVMPYDITVSAEDVSRLGAVSGMKVAAVVDGWPKGAMGPEGHIVDVLGEPGENDTEMHAILAEYALPYRFEQDVENAADSISEEITEKDIKSRRDFRDVLTFTIDPADAKDFDDALSFRMLENGNYEVGVHIADVTHYVTPGSAVEEEARKRSTSVYLVDRTVPMLPEKLSNKLCSLRPGEPKLTFSAVFELTPLAKVVSSWFGRTVIDSNYRFAYETAQQVIDAGEKAMSMKLRGGTDGSVSEGAGVADGSAMGKGVTEGMLIPDELKRAILVMDNLASKLRKKRFAAGAISFERPEMKVEVDEKGRPVRVYQKISREANWLIEEFMLLANRSVAEFVATGCKGTPGCPLKGRKVEKTFVYRIHDEPNQEKLENLRSFIHNFGYTMGPTGNGKEISKELNGLFQKAKDTPEYNAIELLSLRTMAKARYDTENIGHYGLAFKYYTHFTSPIRRYPDMMVHRLLAMYLDGAESQKKDVYDKLCKYSSEREVVAAEAERSSIKYKLVEYMQDKVGYEFEGHISGLTEWGMYVEVEPTKIEGMVSLRDIRSDFFEFDQDRYRIVGKRSGVVYNLGDYVKIRVKKANLEQKLLDYELVETGQEEREDRTSVNNAQTGASSGPASEASAGANKAARKEKVRKAIADSKKRAARKNSKKSSAGKSSPERSSAGKASAEKFSSGKPSPAKSSSGKSVKQAKPAPESPVASRKLSRKAAEVKSASMKRSTSAKPAKSSRKKGGEK
ncbi:MAG: RNB domain-containing ribonuclease [Clostridium sp.]|nr:RNB domain-containing ribonuclease [Bacteroides sp.]MCM1197730.1 RNB domain-containing ribonuclease [Clostridium sp.]